MKKCLITGSTGLVGSLLWKELTKEYELYLICSSKDKLDVSKYPNVQLIEVDLARRDFTEQFPERINYIIHLAQSNHFRRFPDRAEDILAVNTVATWQLCDYARKAQAETFVLLSSGGVYGFGDKPFSEDAQIIAHGNLGFYLTSKLNAELIADNYNSFFNVVTLRPFFIYGPQQRNDMLIPRLVNAVKNHVPIALQGQKGMYINPIHVSDAVRAIVSSLKLGKSEKINIAGPREISMREIGEAIGKRMGIAPIFEIQDAVPCHLIANIAKMQKLLCSPMISLEEGLKDFSR